MGVGPDCRAKPSQPEVETARMRIDCGAKPQWVVDEILDERLREQSLNEDEILAGRMRERSVDEVVSLLSDVLSDLSDDEYMAAIRQVRAGREAQAVANSFRKVVDERRKDAVNAKRSPRPK